MVEEASGSRQEVARILYKEILPGDLRKISAQSNDSDTGGGARDFRFGSYGMVVPVIKEMFPETVQEERKRDGVTTYLHIFKGRFYWHRHDGSVDSQVSFFEPPTDVRPSEGRIVRVHEYGCFDTNLIPKGGVGNRVLLLLIQRKDGKVWPHFAEEKSLRQAGVWDPAVAEELLNCLDAPRAAGRATVGYRDFTSRGRYCNGG